MNKAMRLGGMCIAVGVVGAMMSARALGVPVYSNDFESGVGAFTNGGAQPALTVYSLPTDGGGVNGPNQSKWLGRMGYGIAKGPSSKEIVNLTVTGLVPGTVYTVSFDLLVGASWDGAASGYGLDGWYFSVDGTRLIDTSFSNGDQGRDYGAYSPQRYTDSNYLTPLGPDVLAFTGAEYSRREGPGYSGYYGIYYFSHGAGNPVLTFTAASSSATLEWTRYSGANNFGDSGDEYWALDNVVVDGAAGACAGDLNGDGYVDDSDFVLFVGAYNILDCGDPAMPAGCAADLNGDGTVDDADFVLFVPAYNTLVCP
ncbi:MAG: dockerin type I repeat-containing protein [Phycisphaerae bacterium]|nr:dockerin type I repeat-containing protein [Phycisphaerae bacterium]